MQKWLTFYYFFVCIQSSLTNLLLEFKNQKNIFALNEASGANLNTDKRILKCQPFLHKVYTLQTLLLPGFHITADGHSIFVNSSDWWQSYQNKI